MSDNEELDYLDNQNPGWKNVADDADDVPRWRHVAIHSYRWRGE